MKLDYRTMPFPFLLLLNFVRVRGYKNSGKIVLTRATHLLNATYNLNLFRPLSGGMALAVLGGRVTPTKRSERAPVWCTGHLEYAAETT